MPAAVTPKEYEQQVVSWLRTSGVGLTNFKVEHLKHLSGEAGDYEFDAVAEFTVLNGARIVVLIECKRYNRPVERDHLLALWAKLHDVGAHKAMVFATCGFQRGALEFANRHGIAAIIFTDNTFRYEMRNTLLDFQSRPSTSRFIGTFIHITNESVCRKTFEHRAEPIAEWLVNPLVTQR
jgi:restriction system protein